MPGCLVKCEARDGIAHMKTRETGKEFESQSGLKHSCKGFLRLITPGGAERSKCRQPHYDRVIGGSPTGLSRLNPKFPITPPSLVKIFLDLAKLKSLWNRAAPYSTPAA